MEQQTVVAAFDRPGEAQEALDALLDNGFSSDQARFGSAEGMGGETGTDNRASEPQTLGQKIAHFFGLDDDDATATYSEVMRRGSSVVVVEAVDEEEAQRAANILLRYDPIDMDKRISEWKATGWQPPTMQTDTASRTAEQSTIPVVEEQMQVGTRVVQSGGVRIFARTREIPVEEPVNLREERATITRRPADRPVTDLDKPFEEKSFEVLETREEPVVGKTARVVEEVVVGKETRKHEESVRDSVRKTEVEVEKLDEPSERERSRRRG
jgi:stress response protein YsnF